MLFILISSNDLQSSMFLFFSLGDGASLIGLSQENFGTLETPPLERGNSKPVLGGSHFFCENRPFLVPS